MERRSIQQLPLSLVNRIAAGEVIERPAAVVKELVENAIDAGATQITIEAEDGGRAAIRVIDDGGGIALADLRLAFASHATSKLTCDDDLFRIATMGFRGEALASIGAVSHARILTRTQDSDAAWEITNRGGEISDPQAAAGNVGTTVEVRNLFFNTPARRKFIKGTGTEFGHISETVLRLALPHPRIGFKLLHNGRTGLDLPPTGAEARLLEAWPEAFHEQRLPLDVRDAEMRLRGLIGLPELARPTAKYQYLYLNGRIIRDRFIQHALREAYRGLTEPGRQPAAVLLLEMPPQDVDVNVHPTKIEVRFRDGGRVHGLVMSAIREKLLGSDLTPTAIPMRSDVEDAGRADLREKLAAFFKGQFSLDAVRPAEAEPRLPLGEPVGTKPASPAPVDYSTAQRWTGNFTVGARPASPGFANGPLIEVAGDAGVAPTGDAPFRDPEDVRTTGAGDAGVAPTGVAPFRESDGVRATGEGDAGVAPTDAQFPADARATQASPLQRSAIQLHNSYLVAQSDDGLVIIDQHALHERIMYEELLARVSRGPLESQRLLIPEVIEISSGQAAMLEQVQPLLARIGIEVAPFGPSAVAVQAFPSFLERLDPGTFVRELLERGEQELLDMHQEELLHEVLDMMACKAAVKAGDPLTALEIEALLARRELVERSSNCPHGRPTTLRLSLRDLEKQFKRTGF